MLGNAGKLSECCHVPLGDVSLDHSALVESLESLKARTPTTWSAGPCIHREISADSRIVARFRNEIDTAEHVYDWTHLGKQVAAQIPVARKLQQPERPAESTDLLPDWYAEPKSSPTPAPLAASLEPGNLWYAMQYLPYARLDDAVHSFGPPDQDALIFLARRLLQALSVCRNAVLRTGTSSRPASRLQNVP